MIFYVFIYFFFFSKSEAIKVQFITAIAAFVGTVIGLMSNGAGVWNEILLAITSGGFIYVSTSSLIPSILNKGPESTTTSPYTQVFLFILFFIVIFYFNSPFYLILFLSNRFYWNVLVFLLVLEQCILLGFLNKSIDFK